MKSPELGLSFRSEHKTIPVIREVAQRHGYKQVDFLGVFDDLGDLPPILPLYEAAINLPKNSGTRVGAVGFAIPKYPSMMDLAGYAATLQETLQDPDRVVMGLVPGAWMKEIGLRTATVQQMREATESFRFLMNQNTTGYGNEESHYKIDKDFKSNFKTMGTSPVLLGVWGKRMAELAGEMADEVKIGGSANPLMVGEMRSRLSAGALKANRDTKDIKIALGAVTIIDEDGNLARKHAKRTAAIYIDIVGGKDPTVQETYGKEIKLIKQSVARGDIEGATRFLPDDLADKFVVAGTPKEIISHVEKIFNAGASRFEFGTPHGMGTTANAELESIKMLVEKVFPYFK